MNTLLRSSTTFLFVDSNAWVELHQAGNIEKYYILQ